MSLTVAVDVPAEDRDVLESWLRSYVDAGGVGAAGPDRVAGRRRGGDEGDRRAGRGVQADGDRRGRSGTRPTGSPAWRIGRSRVGRRGRRGRGRGGHAGAAAGEARGHALVVAAAGRSPRDRARDLERVGRQDLARVGPAAVAAGDVQVLHRPQLEAKVRDVVGLYLDPPDNAVVLCVDEKSQIQALDRTAPILPMRPACRRRRPTTTSGTAPPRCSPRWRSRPGRSPTPATRGTATTSSCASSSRSPRPTRE